MTSEKAAKILSMATATHLVVPLPEMMRFVAAEACEVESEQVARLMGEFIAAPMPQQVMRIQKFDALYRLLEQCSKNPRAVKQWLDRMDARR